VNRRAEAILFLFLLVSVIAPAYAKDAPTTSKTINSVLREPLPPEELSLSQSGAKFVIKGPTFTYRVQKTGALDDIRVVRDGQEVIASSGPADIVIDEYHLASTLNSCKVSIVAEGKEQVVLQAKGVLRHPDKRGPEVDFTVLHTFFNDGVVVSAVKLVPRADLLVKTAIVYQLPAKGRFSHYLHKRRDENGEGAARGALPEAGHAVRLSTLTSCLSVFSPTAALAIFTDGGAIHLSQPRLDTALAEVTRTESGAAQVALSQYLVHIAPGDKPYLLKAGEEFGFRVGISLAPNRLPHPRTHDLRMFIWIGDAKYPYPTDEEITSVAQWGYTLFQLHRAGTPGEPRPPAGEFERVLRKVHELGMLYIWEENADLLYDRAPGVQQMKAKGQWSRWQGFNYGGRYKAAMDPYCDLAATCLASPNGMAEYRLANIGRMLDRDPVDGIYLDDNLAYANCTLWKEHGHPRQIYDCLIELHEMNWRRRQLLRSRVPHAVLLSHNTKAFILPLLADFDVQYFGEGYCFDSAQDYWNNYRAWSLAMNAQGMICPGDDEGVRCSAAVACNYDLLTGGGQYSQMDWRLFPKKFHYAGGVTDRELDYSRTYNLAQYYFGLFESKPFYFANSTNLFTTTAPQTYAAVYQNQLWNDWLIPVANMGTQPQTTALVFRSPKALGIRPERKFLLFDVHQRIAKVVAGDALNQAFSGITVPGQDLQLFILRQIPANAPYHLWGGKRLSEAWDPGRRKLTFEVQGPAGSQDTVFIGGANYGIEQVLVAGQRAAFCFDPAQGLAHGPVTFSSGPLKIEVFCSTDHANRLPETAASGDAVDSWRARPAR
jgi:hypothetical protein